MPGRQLHERGAGERGGAGTACGDRGAGTEIAGHGGVAEAPGGGGGTVSGSYAGVWSGRVCGRGLTMVVSQNGTSLSGTYTLTDPTFSDTFAGSVSGDPPATARLNSTGGHSWWFELTFGSYNQMAGGFYKAEAGGKVCDVSATK